MQKRSLVITSMAIAIGITLLSATITYKKSPKISSSLYSYDTVSGFPFELGRDYAPSTVVFRSSLERYPLNPYLLTLIFWFSGSVAFLWWLKQDKGKKALVLVGVVGFLLMQIDMRTSSSCLGGYPIGYLSRCSDVVSPNSPEWFFSMLNYSFWYVIALVGTTIVYVAKGASNRMVRMFIPPLILTLLSVAFYMSCGGFFCLIPTGRGFPLAFTGDSPLLLFGIDYVFWWVVYNLVMLIIGRLNRLESNRRASLE